jgi:hypothetical protein
MIPDIDRYHGVVLRQLVVAAKRPLVIQLADRSGRFDCYRVGDLAMQIKHSSKRLSPWQFTFTAEQMDELTGLANSHRGAWSLLVCGPDGVLALSLGQLRRAVGQVTEGTASIRVRRARNSMFRVSGSSEELEMAFPRGVEPMLGDLELMMPPSVGLSDGT